MSGEFGLKKVLGLSDLVAIEVGTTVGAGIFSLTALAATRTGPSVPLAFAAAAVPIVFIMMTVGMLGSALPTVGGTYRYPSRLFSPLWATVGVWCYAIGLVFGALPLYATECVHYLQAVWPALPFKPTAIGLLTLFFLVNLIGIEIAASAQAVMVAVLIAALVAFGGIGLKSVTAANFVPPLPGGLGGFVLAACILTFALQGSNSVIELGAEIKRPARDIPLSLLISIPLVTVLYILVAVAAIGNIDYHAWIAMPNANLTQPARAFLSSGWFLFFLFGGAIFAFTTTLNGTFMWATKSLMVVARDGIIPPALARTGRFGTPVAFLAILWAGSVIAVLANAGIKTFASYATIGGMIIFIPSMISAWLLPQKAPAVYNRPGFRLRGKMLYVAPGIGIITSALLIVILLADLKIWAVPFLVWFGLGFAFYYLRKRSVEAAAGTTFQEIIDQDLAAMVGQGPEPDAPAGPPSPG
jgi:APA family basic amino acid/polyamine antiporter